MAERILAETIASARASTTSTRHAFWKGAKKTDSDVVYAEPNYIVHIDDAVPNDPLFSQMWGCKVRVRSFERYRGSSGADVAVIPA